MNKLLVVAAALAAAMLAAKGAGSSSTMPNAAPGRSAERPALAHGAALSIMTYNVEGLPWPVALGRPAALAEIGHRFALLRQRGAQPHVVLLQEAFISDAKAVGAAGGYRYFAIGPQARDASAVPTASIGSAFRADARWRKGEDDGKWVDSGLVILSDYPIVSTASMAFPRDVCAGYDCLAAKGALLARIEVPGTSRPVAVVDTHLNSRGASGVSVARANGAFAWQAQAVRRFVSTNVDAATDVILGGDFNIGHDPLRIGDADRDGGLLPGGNEAIATVVGRADRAGGLAGDLAAVRDRAKDKEYFRAATGTKLELRDVRVPFGMKAQGFQLSDHLGFVSDFDLK